MVGADGVIDGQAWIVALPDVEDVDLAGIQQRCDPIEERCTRNVVALVVRMLINVVRMLINDRDARH